MERRGEGRDEKEGERERRELRRKDEGEAIGEKGKCQELK